MKPHHHLLTGVWVLMVISIVEAQPPQPKPGPEHALLKQFEGTWDASVKAGPNESKGVMVYKMDLNGLWLVSDFQGSIGPEKFQGKGLDSYDPMKKKFVGVWVDTMSTAPMIAEGSFDKAGKVLTMNSEAPDPDGKPTKYKMVTEIKDKDSMVFTIFAPGPGGKEVGMMTIQYKRKK